MYAYTFTANSEELIYYTIKVIIVFLHTYMPTRGGQLTGFAY